MTEQLAAELVERGFEARHIPMFWAKVNKTPLCWEWTGGRDARGYGRFKVGTRKANRAVRTHRVAWLLLRGPIPEGLVIDHLCRNKACLRPSHLEPVTQGENVRRGNLAFVAARIGAERTHCKHGHAFDEANTYWLNGNRNCRACHSAREATRRAQGAQLLEPRFREPERTPHGTMNGYRNWGCRCDLCRDGNNAYYRARRARLKAGAA